MIYVSGAKVRIILMGGVKRVYQINNVCVTNKSRFIGAFIAVFL